MAINQEIGASLMSPLELFNHLKITCPIDLVIGPREFYMKLHVLEYSHETAKLVLASLINSSLIAFTPSKKHLVLACSALHRCLDNCDQVVEVYAKPLSNLESKVEIPGLWHGTLVGYYIYTM